MNNTLISRSRTVISKVKEDTDGGIVTFSNLEDNDAFITKKVTIIPIELWEVMGSPEEITVTVEPGNTINQDLPTHEQAIETLGLAEPKESANGN